MEQATAGLLVGATAVWLFRGELFRASQFNPPDRSIAVLPFADVSETKDQGYLCDGISEEILHTLAQVDGLRVVGRTSSFSLKGKNPKEVGEKLNVANVLEGSLQRQGNRVRVTAELVDAQNGFRVWTETYDRELDRAFALQDDIARSIVDALKIKLGVQLAAHEQPRNRLHDRYLQRLFTNLTPPRGRESIDINVPLTEYWSIHSSGLHIFGRFRATPPGHSRDRCAYRDGIHYQCAFSRIGRRSANEQNYSGHARCASRDGSHYQCA